MNKYRPVYGRGSGDYDSDVDPVRELRWNLFSADNEHLTREQKIIAFKEKFGYE
jgi:hypothetical protein